MVQKGGRALVNQHLAMPSIPTGPLVFVDYLGGYLVISSFVCVCLFVCFLEMICVLGISPVFNKAVSFIET